MLQSPTSPCSLPPGCYRTPVPASCPPPFRTQTPGATTQGGHTTFTGSDPRSEPRSSPTGPREDAVVRQAGPSLGPGPGPGWDAVGTPPWSQDLSAAGGALRRRC